jgi:hypothetical protein
LTGCIRSSSPTTFTPGSGTKRRHGPAADRLNALARVGENSLTIAWVHHSLTQRCAAYRFALDHLVAAESERVAADADVVLTKIGAKDRREPGGAVAALRRRVGKIARREATAGR